MFLQSIALVMLFILSSCATPSLEDMKNSYQEDSVSISNKKTLKENYLSSREYVALAFNDSKSVIQMDDKESGTIIAKGIMSCPLASTFAIMGGSSSDLSFVMKITNKDNVVDVKFMDLKESRWSPPSQYSAGGIMKLPITDAETKKTAKICVDNFKLQIEEKLKI